MPKQSHHVVYNMKDMPGMYMILLSSSLHRIQTFISFNIQCDMQCLALASVLIVNCNRSGRDHRLCFGWGSHIGQRQLSKSQITCPVLSIKKHMQQNLAVLLRKPYKHSHELSIHKHSQKAPVPANSARGRCLRSNLRVSCICSSCNCRSRLGCRLWLRFNLMPFQHIRFPDLRVCTNQPLNDV